MSDLKRVSKPPFLWDGRGPQVIAVLVVIVLLALIKPWGPPTERSSAAFAIPTPTATPTPAPTPTADLGDGVTRPYDPLIFGDKEMQPAWGLWPAGYLVTFGFAMRAEPDASSAPSGGPVAPGDAASPAWPEAIDVRVGNHLLSIGVNTPLGYRVRAIALTRRTADGRTEVVTVARPTPPWPSHFTVIGVAGGGGTDRLAFWVPGLYRLQLTIDPGPIVRSIEVRVEGDPIAATPSPAGTSAPSASRAP